MEVVRCMLWSNKIPRLFQVCYRGSVRKLDARGIVQDAWELKRVSWIHDMVETTQGERIVAVGETESRADRYSIAESAIVGTWLPHLTLVLTSIHYFSLVFNVRIGVYEVLVRCNHNRGLNQ